MDPAWERVQGYLLRLDSGGATLGHAVVIDPRGLFLAPKSVVSSATVVGWAGPSNSVALTVAASDETTQLVLLHADNWAPRVSSGVRIMTQVEPGARLIVATPNGPVRAEFVSGDRIGVVRPSLRYAPLTEIRLESAIGPVGGSPVFTESGALAGVLGATLVSDRSGLAPVAGGPMKAAAEADDGPSVQVYGPQGMTVGYSLSPVVLKRVVHGFLGPERRVKHPSIGVFFKSATEGVALEVVMPGSPAHQAGLRSGDVVLAANGRLVRTPVEFAKVLFRSEVGDEIRLTVRSGKAEREVVVTVGAQDPDF
jgi:S1-C subfamily serine protease